MTNDPFFSIENWREDDGVLSYRVMAQDYSYYSDIVSKIAKNVGLEYLKDYSLCAVEDIIPRFEVAFYSLSRERLAQALADICQPCMNKGGRRLIVPIPELIEGDYKDLVKYYEDKGFYSGDCYPEDLDFLPIVAFGAENAVMRLKFSRPLNPDEIWLLATIVGRDNDLSHCISHATDIVLWFD